MVFELDGGSDDGVKSELIDVISLYQYHTTTFTILISPAF